MSGLDYGVVSPATAPTPPPMPGQIVTHFPASNPNPMPNYYNSTNSSALSNGQMIEKRRVSIVNTNGSSLNGNSLSGKHSLSSNINIITSPDRHILPGVYK